MKWTWFAVSLAVAGPLALAQPHRHSHRHAEKRSPDTEIVWELEGKRVDDKFVQEGLKAGTLVKVGNTVKTQDPPSESKVKYGADGDKDEDAKQQSRGDHDEKDGKKGKKGKKGDDQGAKKGDDDKKDGDDKKGKGDKNKDGDDDKEDKKSEGGKKSGGGGGKGVDEEFPDGKLDCSTFPSDYGAIEIPWTKLGGWTGLQQVEYNDDGSAIKDIHTGISGPCKEGMMCSYACPPGYEKAQWPSVQGAKGQSVGGIECKDGKLRLPQGSTSKKLCRKGYGGVKVHNKIGKPIAVCRTDYPGTEAMTIPATLDISSSEPYDLTCPDAAKTYVWQKKATSAQYYVNPAGTSLEEACTWNKKGSNKGNFAPMNVGVGRKDGATWTSIFQNKPSNVDGKLSFNVRIVGGNLPCKYEDGEYYRGDRLDPSKWTRDPDGCTTQGDDVTFEFY
ncbi:MAG: hypothetical protein M1823_005737 [Watsoniomyces obsoletus]|nr:MAG: hypothetical protein M1823_005737 [Watsoniomyces obsoletus]